MRHRPHFFVIPAALCWALFVSRSAGQAVAKEPADRCEDKLAAVAALVPDLDHKFFRTTETSFAWHIVEGDDGKLEDTMDGTIDPEDLMRVEHTAHCRSTHQGDHAMDFCDAERTADGVRLVISGGMPAYASELTVTLNSKREFQCAFSAVYPAATNPLRWRVTKKAMKLKKADFAPGNRLRGWISVDFEEIDQTTKEAHSYHIEGYFKPVIASQPKAPPPP